MSRDHISDTLNQIMNAKRAGKKTLVVAIHSKLLIKVLEMMKQYGYLDYSLENEELKITILEVSECKAIKPRYNVKNEDIEKYIRRFLPARNFGYVLVSTSKGLMTHQEASENKIGGSLIAYFY